MHQNGGRKRKKLLAVQIYETEISNFKRSTALIWLCLCFGILVCSFFLLNRLLFELNSIENVYEQRSSGSNSIIHQKSFENENDSIRVNMIDINVVYFYFTFILNHFTIQSTTKTIYVQIGHSKYHEHMLQTCYIFGQSPVVSCTSPIVGHVVKMEVHSFQSITMNLERLKNCTRNTITITMHRSISHCIAAYQIFDFQSVDESSTPSDCPK